MLARFFKIPLWQRTAAGFILGIIAGLIPASTGSVLANGKDLSGANASTAMVKSKA